MLQTKYKTNSLMRCKNLGFAIPLGSILVLLLLISLTLILPWQGNSSAYANDNTSSSNSVLDYNSDTGVMPTADSPSASLSIANSTLSSAGEVGDVVSMSSNVSINATLINSYHLQISGNPVLEGPSTINAITSTVATAEELIDNTWGYSWNNGNYQGISTSNVTIDNSGIDSNGNVSYTKPLTFVAKFNKDANAGHYKTKVNLLLTATPKTLVTYTLSYDGNGGSGVPDPASQSINSYDDTYIFTAAAQGTLAKVGYTFLGWSESSTATTATYTAGTSITLTKDNPSRLLYAVWKLDDPWANITTMQQMTSSACAAASIGKSKTLIDDRNYPSDINKTYTIRKMEDGKCWMTQNLRITGATMTSADSNVSSSYSLPSSSTLGFSNDSAQNAYYDPSKDTGYYTWCAATANTCTSATLQGDNATSSICPKGWTLPAGTVVGKNTTNDFWNLFRHMDLAVSNDNLDQTGFGTVWGSEDLAKVQGSPYNFTYTGRMRNNSGPQGDSTGGYWWSRTASDSTSAYRLRISSSDIYPGTYSNVRQFGFAVRCITQ